MLRPNLAPLDIYLADAMMLDDDDFLARHEWPMLVVVEPTAEALAQVQLRRVTLPPSDQESVPPPNLRLDVLCLEVRSKNDDTFERITIGRSPDSDIVLLDDSVSKLHAELSWEQTTEQAVLTDLDSKNGTFVADKRLVSRGHAHLEPGVLVKFGTLGARFYPPRAFLSWLNAGAART